VTNNGAAIAPPVTVEDFTLKKNKNKYTEAKKKLINLVQEKIIHIMQSPNFVSQAKPVEFYIMLEKHAAFSEEHEKNGISDTYRKVLLKTIEKHLTLEAIWNERTNPIVAEYIILNDIEFPEEMAFFLENKAKLQVELLEKRAHQYDNINSTNVTTINAPATKIQTQQTSFSFFPSEVKYTSPVTFENSQVPSAQTEIELQNFNNRSQI